MNHSLAILLPPSLLVFALTGCSMSAPTCARTPEVQASVSKGSVHAGGSSARSLVPISIDYKLMRADTVLIAGQSDFEGAGATNIDQLAPHENTERLRVNARAESGKILVSLDYMERTNDGREISWSPTLSLAPGATAAVKLDLAGGETRKIIISARSNGETRASDVHPVVSLSQ